MIFLNCTRTQTHRRPYGMDVNDAVAVLIEIFALEKKNYWQHFFKSTIHLTKQVHDRNYDDYEPYNIQFGRRWFAHPLAFSMHMRFIPALQN